MSYKLLSLQSAPGPRAAVLIGDLVFDAVAVSGNAEYATALGVSTIGQTPIGFMHSIAKDGPPEKGGEPLQRVTLLAPVLYPSQIFAAGANYQDHVAELKGGVPWTEPEKLGARPWHFPKSSRSAVIGHGSTRLLSPYSRKVDWDIELAVVIGNSATRVPAAQALEYLAGYTIANDLSARDFVARRGARADRIEN